MDRQGPPPARRAFRRHGERRLTPFERALRDRIRAEGPITVEAYMHACNAFYYAIRDPLGAAGDFTTAPEISQMFGELVGAALADVWKRAGGSVDAAYVELGPGRGTLAADALRVMWQAEFAGEGHFVETSPVLRAAQRERHPDAHSHESLETLPKDRPLLIVANEFLDALPVQQFVNGIERRVTIAADGLAFDRDGQIVEQSLARDETAAAIAKRLTKQSGVALIIDYGHEKSAPGDTLQALRRHRFASVFANPGEQDLTAHVDFEALARAAAGAGAAVTRLVTQSEWLERLGIGARAAALAQAHPDRAADLHAARDRLCNPDKMGELFKVIAIHSPDWPPPAGFE